MSLKNTFKKYFSKKRHVVAVAVIVILLTIIGLNNYLPIGPGNYNQRQVGKIHSSPPSDHFSFAVMGDNKNSFKIFSKILKDIDSSHYAFAIDVGDLVFDGEKEKYRIFYNMIKNERTPFLVAIGNHDIREGGAENYFDIFGKFYYSFDYGNSLFIVLDDANEERIDAVQMKWLEEQLQKDYRHKFVFLHVPLFDPRPKFNHSLSNKQNVEEFMNLMEKYKPDIVFASHIHAYFDEIRNGINYVITGGAGSELMGIDPDHYFNHYVKIEVDGDKVSKEVVKFPSTDYNWIDRSSYNIWTYINSFWVTHKFLVILILTILILLTDVFVGKLKELIKKQFAAKDKT
ncbi:alkaline phosphatase precursor [bacterium BMS3Abin15]|nr:alkaline phosphatase precursor [bacterium BMS3Abin15]HDZ85027.1 metallophosphoesterase [Candidatus Moranbacteria bacterium]